MNKLNKVTITIMDNGREIDVMIRFSAHPESGTINSVGLDALYYIQKVINDENKMILSRYTEIEEGNDDN